MREEPPQKLIDLVERLELATATEVRKMHRRVRRLARELPPFESVWVDALAQARILTPFQAAEINADRGDSLRVGPYVVCRPLVSPAYVNCYRAEEIGSAQAVRLVVFQSPSDETDVVLGKLEALAAAGKSLESGCLAPVIQAGADGRRVWAASRYCGDRTTAEWLVHNGRFPPEVVLEIARQMLTGLVMLEKAGICHGDLSASGLLLTKGGNVVLPQPGLRGVIRPEEGYAHADLSPENYDYLAPERIRDGTPPTVLGDVYSCGCLWWHLLTGRPPVPGGSSLAKLRSQQTAEIHDVRLLAPDTPAPLAAAVSASVRREPSLRPESMGRLSAMLALPTHAGRLALARCVSRAGVCPVRWSVRAGAIHQSKQTPVWLAAVAGCLVAAVAIFWAIWRTGLPIPVAGILPEKPPAERHRPEVADPPRPLDLRDGPLPKIIPKRVTDPAVVQTTAREYGPATQVKPLAGPSNDLRANHSIPTGNEPDGNAPTGRQPDDLVLAAKGPLAVESLDLQPGQRVCGESNVRPLVVVPATGLVIRPENVRFENIDFVCDDTAAGAQAAGGTAAIIHLQASRAEFRGCSFQGARPGTFLPKAIRWTHPVEREQLSLPSGQVRLSNCVFRNVEAGIVSETIGALSLELANVLYLGTGPLIQLDHCPKLDEPVGIGLTEVTLRNAGPLLECRYGRIEAQPGNISIQANGCAFAPGAQTGLLRFAGPGSPGQLVQKIYWTGQGSLVSPEAVIAAWRQPDGRVEVLDDTRVSIAGVVRSQVAFAGPAEAGPDASQIIEWQVPLRSANPPGIDAGRLCWPDF